MTVRVASFFFSAATSTSEETGAIANRRARRERRGGAARPDVEHPALVVVVQAGVLSGSPSDLAETDA